MVRHHVAHGSGGFIEARPLLYPNGLGHRNLHVVDMIAIPQRLKDPVGEPLDHDVLDRLLPKKMVHPINLVFVERS